MSRYSTPFTSVSSIIILPTDVRCQSVRCVTPRSITAKTQSVETTRGWNEACVSGPGLGSDPSASQATVACLNVLLGNASDGLTRVAYPMRNSMKVKPFCITTHITHYGHRCEDVLCVLWFNKLKYILRIFSSFPILT